MEPRIEIARNRILNAAYHYGVLCCRGEAEPAPGYIRAIRLALRCVRRGRFNLAARVAQSNPTSHQIWTEARIAPELMH